MGTSNRGGPGGPGGLGGFLGGLSGLGQVLTGSGDGAVHIMQDDTFKI